MLKHGTLVVLTSLFLATGAGALEKKLPLDRSDTSITRPTEGGVLHRIQTFDGAALTDVRAKQLAEAMGFTLVKFFPCAYPTDSCAMVEVQGPRGNVFLYQLSSEHCVEPVRQSHAPAESERARPRPTAESKRPDLKVAPGKAGDPTGGSKPSLDEYKGVKTSQCFAGYTVDYRVQEANTLFADFTGYLTSVVQHVQLVVNGDWQEVATATTTSWDLLKEVGRGTHNRGWTYELRDSAGNALTSKSETYDWIASGNTSEIPLKERCALEKEQIEKDMAAVSETFYTACIIATLAIPDTLTGTFDLKVLGVGGTVEAAKNQALCSNMKSSQAAITAAGAHRVYKDCIDHPGRYFPGTYPPEPGTLDLKILPGFVSPYAVLLQGENAPQNCPASYVSHEVADVGGGHICEGDVRYQCEKKVSGACECENPQVEGPLTCTDEIEGRAKR